MSMYENIKFILISPDELKIPEYLKTEILDKKNIPYTEVTNLEENIEKLDTVEGINIYKFDYINGAKNQVGVIAQEVMNIPGAVVTQNDGYYAVDYSKLPIKVQERIEELKNV
jgi:hypothetical protein